MNNKIPSQELYTSKILLKIYMSSCDVQLKPRFPNWGLC